MADLEKVIKEKALSSLEEDRKAYIKKTILIVQTYLNMGKVDLAAHCLSIAGDQLKSLDGAIQYLTALKDNEYPRFNAEVLG